LTNHLTGLESVPREALEKLVLCLSPFAPHLAEELWGVLGHAPSLAKHPWPGFDEAWCDDDVLELPVQVNGKVRGRVMLSKTASEAEALEAAMKDERIAALVAEKPMKKFVYVPGKILNVIL
jgi:leucyl-tRNA synthetase